MGGESSTDGIVVDVVNLLIQFWPADDVSVITAAGLPEPMLAIGSPNFAENWGVEFFPSCDDFNGAVSFEIPSNL